MQSRKKFYKNKLVVFLVAIVIAISALGLVAKNTIFQSSSSSKVTQVQKTKYSYKPTQDEVDYLSNKFAGLTAINSEAIAYIYAPGTQLDEPVVQTTDNYTYLNKTFEGENIPYLGAVFMDPDNKKDFSDRLTWLFGHARGSQVADHRMFNDVNYYSDQTYFNEHPYVVIETPTRKYYYEALAMVIVPETTAFYRTSFKDADDFKKQLDTVYEQADVKNENIKINKNDKYLVLSTCREEDPTIRANLYLRQIPDNEMSSFVAEHKDQLIYQATR